VADITFTPNFHHVEFIDDDGQATDPDRVRAGEPNGFNARLTAIENDLNQFATVVSQINTALTQGTIVPRQTVWLPPAFGAGSTLTYTDSGAPQFHFTTSELMNLILPAAATLVSVRAIGQITGGPATLELFRAPIANPQGPAEVIATTSVTGNPFDVTATVTDPSKAPVDNTTFHYHIRFTSGTAATGVPITATLGTFAISFDPA
jgi:hypothetical protein